MNIAIAERWVEALRSGKYTQGKNLLKQKYESGQIAYCCLGVLCELYMHDHPDNPFQPALQLEMPKADSDNGDRYVFGSDCEIPPAAIQKWAGIYRPSCVELAEFNDSGESFDELADRISEYAERL
jgi:hypothetical protein